MKKLNWKQWTAIGVTAAVVITEVVLCFVNPTAAIAAGAGFVLGAGCLGLALRKVEEKKNEEASK